MGRMENDTQSATATLRGLVRRTSNHWLAVLLAALLVVCGVATAWHVTGDDDHQLLHLAKFVDFLLSTWMLATYAVVGVLFVISVAFLHFGHRVVGLDVDLEIALRRQRRFWIAAYSAFAVLTVAIGYLSAVELHESMTQDAYEQQRTIARLKARQIDKWVAERRLDAEHLANSLSGIALDRLQSDGMQAGRVMLGLREYLAGHLERVAVSLLAADGTVLANLEKDAGAGPEIAAALGSLLARGRSGVVVDTYSDDTPSQIRIGIVTAVGGFGGVAPVAFLATTLDPVPGLLKDVEAWPGPSPSSEILLIRRARADVVFLTPPRLAQASSPTQLREMMIERGQPTAVRGMVEGNGIRNGPDYRGVEAVTASWRVESLPWHVVAKTDRAELEVPIRDKQLRVAAAVGLTLLIAAAMVFVMALGQQASAFAYFNRIEAGRHVATQRYAHLFGHAPDIVLALNAEGRIVEANEAAIRAYGYSMDELRALTLRDLHTSEEPIRSDQQWPMGSASERVLFETVHQRKDGSTLPVEVSGYTFEIEGRPLRQAFIHDISRSKKLQRDHNRLARIQRVMQQATRILLQANSDRDLFQGMCDTIIDAGSYRLVAIGIGDRDERHTLRYIASAGRGDGFLDRVDGTWGADPQRRGLAGNAIRLGTVQVGSAFATNPDFATWRDAAAVRGLRSGVALPLRVAGEVLGALSIYSDEPDAFDSQELELLEMLADDISYGLDGLRERQSNQLLRLEIARALTQQSMLQSMMRTLVRARSEAELYREVCVTMVEVAGFRLVAVAARAGTPQAAVKYLAVHGTDEGYLAEITQSGEEQSDANEPSASALNTGEVHMINDTYSDQAVGKWRDQAARRGLRSGIALPLKHSGKAFAVLVLWAGPPGAFDEKVTETLKSLAEDLAIRVVDMRTSTR